MYALQDPALGVIRMKNKSLTSGDCPGLLLRCRDVTDKAAEDETTIGGGCPEAR